MSIPDIARWYLGHTSRCIQLWCFSATGQVHIVDLTSGDQVNCTTCSYLCVHVAQEFPERASHQRFLVSYKLYGRSCNLLLPEVPLLSLNMWLSDSLWKLPWSDHIDQLQFKIINLGHNVRLVWQWKIHCSVHCKISRYKISRYKSRCIQWILFIEVYKGIVTTSIEVKERPLDRNHINKQDQSQSDYKAWR